MTGAEHSAEKDALQVGMNVRVGSLGVTGTVTKIDSVGVHVRLHSQANGSMTCCASRDECSVVTRATPPERTT